MRKKVIVDEYGNQVEKSVVGTAFHLLMGLISLAIFLVVFARMFQTRDSAIADDILLDPSAYRLYSAANLQVKLPDTHGGFDLFQPLAPSRFVCFSVHPSTTMDSNGRLQVRQVFYLASAGSLQLTLRLNTKYYPQDQGLGYDFALRLIDGKDGTATVCTDYQLISDVRSGYTFLRIAFGGLHLEENTAVRFLMLPRGAEPTDSSYLNLKIFGSDIYTQSHNANQLDIHPL